MILAAGLTPAWQQILTFPRFIPGEVNRASQANWCASGKVLNVGCALHLLGVPSKTLCLIGGETGRQVRADFEELHAAVRWIESREPTRVCTTILDQSTGRTTELVENSRRITDDELARFANAFVEEAVAAQVVVLTGSLPEGAPTNFFRRLLEKIRAKTVLDIRGAELNEALETKPFIVKPNREELAKTVGRQLVSDEDVVEAMSELRQRGAEWVVTSNGSAPLLALGPEGLVRIEPPRIVICNPIGCGDCLAAGIAAGIDQGMSMRDAFALGVRAAAENAQGLLPARNVSRWL